MPPPLLDRMRPIVDSAIGSLARTKFRVDPVGGETYSKATSIVSAAYKRHGAILEYAIRERLSDCQYFQVWHESEFAIPSAVDHVISGRNADIEGSLPIEMPYGGRARTLQVDAFVYDQRVNTLRAYEIKRGNGDFDAGKKRSILRDVMAIQTLLRSYAKTRGLNPGLVESRLISYYGVRVLPAPFNLNGRDLDDHFAFLVRDHIETVNAYFKERLYELLDRETGLSSAEGTKLCDACPLHHRAA